MVDFLVLEGLYHVDNQLLLAFGRIPLLISVWIVYDSIKSKVHCFHTKLLFLECVNMQCVRKVDLSKLCALEVREQLIVTQEISVFF